VPVTLGSHNLMHGNGLRRVESFRRVNGVKSSCLNYHLTQWPCRVEWKAWEDPCEWNRPRLSSTSSGVRATGGCARWASALAWGQRAWPWPPAAAMPTSRQTVASPR